MTTRFNVLPIQEKMKREMSEVRAEVIEFFRNRVVNILVEKGYRKDIVEAVVAAGFDNIAETEEKQQYLKK